MSAETPRRCIYCGAPTDAAGGGCARCNRARSLPEDWTSRLVAYPFVLSDGTAVQLDLPAMLSAPDAERLCAMVRSLVLRDRFAEDHEAAKRIDANLTVDHDTTT